MTREVSIGAALRAFRELGATTDDERRAIARLLGYDLAAAVAVGEPAPLPPPRPRVDPAPAREPEPPAPPPSLASEEPATELIRLPDLVRNELALPAPLPRPAAAVAPTPAAPLFAPAWSRTIVARLGARLAPVGAFDATRLVERVATRAPIRALPRRLRLISAPAITVVLDSSGAMPWLAADQAELVAQLRATLRPAIDLVTSDGPPAVLAPGTRAAPELGDDLDVEPAISATSGGRVLAISDLGVSAWEAPTTERVAAWRAFATQLAAHGASLVVVTPVPAARLPRALHHLRCVHWDRRTRPSAIHALVKELR